MNNSLMNEKIINFFFKPKTHTNQITPAHIHNTDKTSPKRKTPASTSEWNSSPTSSGHRSEINIAQNENNKGKVEACVHLTLPSRYRLTVSAEATNGRRSRHNTISPPTPARNGHPWAVGGSELGEGWRNRRGGRIVSWWPMRTSDFWWFFGVMGMLVKFGCTCLKLNKKMFRLNNCALYFD